MNGLEAEALQYAQEFAPQAEVILGITGVQAELAKVSRGEIRFGEAASKSLESLGDVGSIAAALISLFSWIGQIRQGQIMRNASREAIVADLAARVLSDPSLSEGTKERLILAAFEKLSPEIQK